MKKKLFTIIAALFAGGVVISAIGLMPQAVEAGVKFN
jgi:hypothetical protein